VTPTSAGWPARAAFAVLGLAVLAASILAAVSIGEIRITPGLAVAVIAHHLFDTPYTATPIQAGIVWDYRLTRALLAACCGSGLAVSGAVLQALLRNSLAEPYTLGISAGASTGAVAVILTGLGGGLLSLSSGAFIGAIVALLAVAALAFKAGGGPERIILAGVAGSQLFNAVTSYIVTTAANAEQARGVMFWLLGNLSGARWSDVALTAPVTCIALILCLGHAKALDAFTFGADAAATLGISVIRVRVVLFATTALVTAAMVSSVGSIGFVGLVVPHAARLLVGPMHGRLLPATLLAGAIFTVWADILSRVLVPEQTLPIGVVTALIGAPCFALILQRGERAR
jgi:iron complex transport system permease protein